ncbi:hypothetical protein OXYTRIMIC_573 [Oxytricha trifallax]|uniref:Ubiquitin-like protease family profile domain-containing protein n=1 Tax=Oxytricha trifallax TaxID=1172189 RepID=A0A073HY31_9SPIT|nr:hypothetical protein OXYTRIMIC_573 [Oxytricha trifallax]
MVTIVCCPSTRSKMEKALVRRYDDRAAARKRGVKEEELWTEKQKAHWIEINDDWQHMSLIPGKHIQEETMEQCLKLIEEVQFNEQRLSQIILPPIVLNDRGITQLEKCIGTMNWKIENCKFWRQQEHIEAALLPVCCQSSIRNCQNWIILKIAKHSHKLEMMDTRRQVGSYAIVQKHMRQLSSLLSEVLGKEYAINQISKIQEINQVKDPEDYGIMAILMINHLALELQGQPVFQIFAKDWLNMQRYYLMLNLELGFVKIDIGRSGLAIEKEEMEVNREKKSEALWLLVDKDLDTTMINLHSQIDVWDELVLKNATQFELEREDDRQGGEFSDVDEDLTEAEWYLSNDGSKAQHQRQDFQGKKDTKEAQEMIKASVQTPRIKEINQMQPSEIRKVQEESSKGMEEKPEEVKSAREEEHHEKQ